MTRRSGAEQDRGAAEADRAAAARTQADRAVEEGIDFAHAGLDGDDLRTTLDEEIGVETVAFVHLEREAAEIAQPFLPYHEQRLSLALELARGRDDVGGVGIFLHSWRMTTRSSVISRTA